MRLIADLHIHSRFSRATSPRMDLPALARWAKIKGIGLLGTGDFTHPQWLKELRDGLVPEGNGLYHHDDVRFMLTTEISAIWSQDGRVRKVHLLVLAPAIEVVERINRDLSLIGNLASDGRPILGISAQRLAEVVWNAEETAELIPAHVWTPWFSLFGSRSGFDSLEECFGPYTKRIFAIETGLSSDPPMNWRLSALDHLTLISNSDAHSPSKLGREATLFDLPDPSYAGVIDAMKTRDPSRFLGTIEFHPQEGKYHYDGHRKCGIVLSPREAIAHDNICPVCGKPLTIGVLHRVEDLADRDDGRAALVRPPFRSLVPLEEIISQALKVGVKTKTVSREYTHLIEEFRDEFRILLDLSQEEMEGRVPSRILRGIMRVRSGDVQISPGYDGVYGQVRIPLDF
ncbi:MAG TPA: DNA helicase UvrD [Candidatus Acetothermia bacterium]|nr:DNA helicase UvrD [Candidatus Acetothermia bacterium]